MENPNNDTIEVHNIENQDDRHNIVTPTISEEEYSDIVNKASILLPGSTYEAILKTLKIIDTIDPKEFEKLYSKKQILSTGINIESGRTTTKDNVFVDNLNESDDKYVNTVNYSDKELVPRPINFKQTDGVVSGSTAIARFTSLLGVGVVTQIPLWHSGIWLTIKPPKQTDIINLEIAIANNQIQLGRETNTLVYSNYSVIYNRLVIDFILKHVVDSTLKLPEDDDIRKYISMHDMYPLILAMISSMYPEGIPVTRTCVNTNNLKEDKTPLCDFIASAKLDTNKLLWVNRKVLNNKMLTHMSKRIPNSSTVDEVKEYQLSISKTNSKTITIETENSIPVIATIAIPNLYDYLINGELWIQNIIKEAEEIFSSTDSIETKNSKVNDILMTVILGIYNVFVKKIESNNMVIEDNDTIVELLTVLSNDNIAFKSFINSIKTYISESAIAIVATPNYECPNCKAQQNDNIKGPFKELIPLNILESFFDLSVLRINKVRNKSIS